MADDGKLKDIIARRSLKIAGSKDQVIVYIGKPRKITEDGQAIITGIYEDGKNKKIEIPKGFWICPFKITGLPLDNTPKTYHAEVPGQDSLEAILSALISISAVLDKCVPPLQWSHSMGFDPGLPIIMPTMGLENKSEIQKEFAEIMSKHMELQAQRPRPAWMFTALKKWARKQRDT